MTTDWRGWSDALTARVAGAVKARRAALGLTAAELSDRTVVGKPLTRAVISDLETGRKKSLEIVELLTLAAALDIPPVLLLFPGYPDATVEVVPGSNRMCHDAAGWFAGTWAGPASGAPVNPGVLLVRAAREHLRARTDQAFAQVKALDDNSVELAEKIALLGADVEIAEQRIQSAKASIWGPDSS